MMKKTLSCLQSIRAANRMILTRSFVISYETFAQYARYHLCYAASEHASSTLWRRYGRLGSPVLRKYQERS